MDHDEVFRAATGFSGLTEFSSHVERLRSDKIPKIRDSLLRRFDEVIQYKDAAEWSRAVALCEALAVTGWGRRERVDAMSRFNGDCWETFFVNAEGERRFAFTRWSKRKRGWSPFNPEYHYSPDRPAMPSQDCRQYKQIVRPLVAVKALPSQRNYQRQTPIIMGMFGGENEVSDLVVRMMRDLGNFLTKNLRPNDYGDALEFFYMTLHCPFQNTKFENALKTGSYNSKKRSYYCDLYFSDSFKRIKPEAQQEYFKANIAVALDRLEEKFRKKKIRYNFAELRKDIEKAFGSWRKSAAH